MATYTHNARCITPKMTANNAPSPVVIAASSEYNSTYKAFKAFDQTYHISGSDYQSTWINLVSASLPHYLTVDLGSGNSKSIDSYTVTAYGGNFCPKNFKVYGSNDGLTWTELDSRTNETSWGSYEMRTYTLASPSASYRYFKFEISAVVSGNQLDIYEMELLETVASGGGALVGGSALVGGQILVGNGPLIN
jgi:hypothetical protein